MGAYPVRTDRVEESRRFTPRRPSNRNRIRVGCVFRHTSDSFFVGKTFDARRLSTFGRVPPCEGKSTKTALVRSPNGVKVFDLFVSAADNRRLYTLLFTLCSTFGFHRLLFPIRIRIIAQQRFTPGGAVMKSYVDNEFTGNTIHDGDTRYTRPILTNVLTATDAGITA